MFCYQRKVHYYETDKMGIVHHSNYVRWFEEARLELLEAIDFPYKKMELMGVLIPVLGVNCEFIHYMTFGDEFLIQCKVDEFNGVKFHISYEVYRASDMLLCARGKSLHTFISKDMKVLRLRCDFPEIYKTFKNLLNEEKE